MGKSGIEPLSSASPIDTTKELLAWQRTAKTGWMQRAERGEKEKKKEKEVTHSCVVRSLLCKAFMLQRKVLLREGEGDQNAGRQMSKHTAARTARGQTLQQRWQTQKLHSACFSTEGNTIFLPLSACRCMPPPCFLSRART